MLDIFRNYVPNKYTTVDDEDALREKCPNTELFLVRIFLYSD